MSSLFNRQPTPDEHQVLAARAPRRCRCWAAGMATTTCCGASATRASSCWARPRTARTTSTRPAPASRTERQSHYFHAQVARQFDAPIHIDRTRAVVPLEADRPWLDGHASHGAEAAETCPQGL